MRVCVCVRAWAYDNRQTDGHTVDPLLVKGSREQDTSWGEITAERDRTQTSGLTGRRRWMDIHRRMDRGSLN